MFLNRHVLRTDVVSVHLSLGNEKQKRASAQRYKKTFIVSAENEKESADQRENQTPRSTFNHQYVLDSA